MVNDAQCGHAAEIRLCPPPRLSFQAMSTVRPAPKPAERRAAKAQPLLVGAQVRLHSKDASAPSWRL
jgi:hypothetical protein